MSEKKVLKINCNLCDTRNMQENMFEGYESVVINANLLIVNGRSKALLSKYAVQIDVNQVLEVSDSCKFSMHNGRFSIQSNVPVSEDMVLMVNGTLEIEPETEEQLKHYMKIMVNGTVQYPQSAASYLTDKLSVNGSSVCYPDKAVLLKPTAVLDKYFPLRAKKNGLYYAQSRVVIMDSQFLAEMLAQKEVKFITKKLIAPESVLTRILGLFDENVDITAVPEGCAFIKDDVTLDKALIRSQGTKLYICGNLTLDKGSAEALSAVEYLYVEGDVYLPQQLTDAFMQVNAFYEKLNVVKGRLVSERQKVCVDRNMLKASPDGVTVLDCVEVRIHPDVPAESILEKTAFWECVRIICSAEQKSAVEVVSRDTVQICTEEDLKEKAAENNDGADKNIVVIDANNYVM